MAHVNPDIRSSYNMYYLPQLLWAIIGFNNHRLPAKLKYILLSEGQMLIDLLSNSHVYKADSATYSLCYLHLTVRASNKHLDSAQSLFQSLRN